MPIVHALARIKGAAARVIGVGRARGQAPRA